MTPSRPFAIILAAATAASPEVARPAGQKKRKRAATVKPLTEEELVAKAIADLCMATGKSPEDYARFVRENFQKYQSFVSDNSQWLKNYARGSMPKMMRLGVEKKFNDTFFA